MKYAKLKKPVSRFCSYTESRSKMIKTTEYKRDTGSISGRGRGNRVWGEED
jgi:hypothetical protein